MENSDAKFIKFPLKDQDKTERMIPSELQVEKLVRKQLNYIFTGCFPLPGRKRRIRTYFLRMVALLLVSVLSVRSSRSRSAVDEPQESPRVSLAWLRLSLLGPGVVADPAVT